MFNDPTIVGSWPDLKARLDGGVLARWAGMDVGLHDVGDVGALLSAWADPERTHRVGFP